MLSMFLEELNHTARQVAKKFGLEESATPETATPLTADELAYYRAVVGTPEARDRLVELVLKASQDGLITADELARIEQVQRLVGVSDVELSAIKLSVLHNLVGQLTLSGVVLPQDMQLLHSLTQGLAFRPEDRPELERILLRLKDLQ